MRASSRHQRQSRRLQTIIVRKSPESVGPGHWKHKSEELNERQENLSLGGVQIGKRVGGGKKTEINSERENQLHQLDAAFAKLHNRGPQNVGENQTDEIQVLRQLQHEMGDHLGVGLLHNAVGKQRGPSQ